MKEKKLVLILEASQGYLRDIENPEKFTAQNSILFSAISETYIPLLNMMARLEGEGIPFKLGIVLSPVVCELLSDAQVQKQYMDYLDSLIELGKKEIERCKGTECENLSRKYLEKYEKLKNDFTEVYEENILAKFRYYAKKDIIELISTTATSAYLPHIEDFTEAVNAQVETGLYSQKYFFGEAGDGFYIPYSAWCKSLEWTLRSYGANYTIVDARSVLFSKECPEKGIFSPVRTRTSLVLFPKDPDTLSEIMGEEGYASNDMYRCEFRDIGFDLSQEELSPVFQKDSIRHQTGFKYWTNESEDDDPVFYDAENAEKQIVTDAMDFYEKKAKKLEEAQKILADEDACLIEVIPMEILGQKWHEGMKWLEEVIRCTASRQGFKLDVCKNMIANQFTLPKITPFPCSSSGLGFGEDFIENSNDWILRYMRKATERMIDIAERFPGETSLKERLLNMASKQILLSQSSDWALMLHNKELTDYVEKLFTNQILTFSRVFDALACNTVSTEWLTNCEKKSTIFPWLNYRVFSKKK